MPNKVDFFTLNELLLNLGAVCSPSELQGVLCGRVSGGDTPLEGAWLDDVMTFMDIEHVTLEEDHKALLSGLYADTRRLMDDVNFGFSPLLPTDESTIERRAQELGSWCEGFLHGLGTSGLGGDATLAPDVADALRDLAQITQISVDEDDDVNENEAYWSELVEYVKVAVLTIYTELSSTSSDKNQPGSEAADQVIH